MSTSHFSSRAGIVDRTRATSVPTPARSRVLVPVTAARPRSVPPLPRRDFAGSTTPPKFPSSSRPSQISRGFTAINAGQGPLLGKGKGPLKRLPSPPGAGADLQQAKRQNPQKAERRRGANPAKEADGGASCRVCHTIQELVEFQVFTDQDKVVSTEKDQAVYTKKDEEQQLPKNVCHKCLERARGRHAHQRFCGHHRHLAELDQFEKSKPKNGRERVKKTCASCLEAISSHRSARQKANTIQGV